MKAFFGGLTQRQAPLAIWNLAGLCLLSAFPVAAGGSSFNDGIPDAWRAQYFGPEFAVDSQAVATADPDGDGANNYLEFLTGTHPLQGGSFESVPARVGTYAGSVQGWQDGFRTESLLNSPRDLIFDAQGRLWFTETTYKPNEPMSHRIRIISTNGTVTTLTGAAEAGAVDGPLGSARFHTPQTPVFDSHGHAYIADMSNHRVRKISPGGIVSTLAGSTAGYRNGIGTSAQFHNVQSVCVDANDNIYVADWDNICIRKIPPDGEVTLFAGRPGVRGRADGPRLQATFETPGHMAFAPNGNMFVIDWANGTLRVIDTNGVVSTFASGIGYAHRVMVDANSNVYATWGVPGPVTYLRKYRPDARIAWTIGGTHGFQDGPIEQAQFAYAFSPALLPNGDIVITDQENHRLRVVEMSVAKLIKISGATPFASSTTVTVATPATGGDVRITLDGSEPTTHSSAYTGPILIDGTTTVKARLFVNGTPVSDVVSATFTAAEIAPVIVQQPGSLDAEAGSTATFTAAATGTAPLSFQWQFNGTPLADGTNATLVLSHVQPSQAGEYAVVVANAFGSATSEVATLTVILPPSLLRVVSTIGASGASVTVPIELMARGQENALGFSLQFDPGRLTPVSVSLGAGAPDTATLVANLNEAASGRIGVLVALPADATFAVGSHSVVLVSFHAAAVTSPTAAFIAFADQPTLRQVADTRARPLLADYQGGSVTLDRRPFEGDAAPRPGGDTQLSVIDWVQLGRFVAALDEVAPDEFQRVDTAPHATLGNGVISVTDWVQVGRYAAGLDPLTPAGGPAAPAPPVESMNSEIRLRPASARMVSLPNMTVAQGGTVSLPVRVDAQANENAFGFSVNFDASKLAFRSATKGSAAAHATLNVNPSQAALGVIGVALALPAGSVIGTGSQEIVWLTFDTATNATGSSAVSFADRPVLREVSDATANALPSSYESGAVTFDTALPPGPPLSLARSGGIVVLLWSASPAGFELEAMDRLGTSWTRVDAAPVEIGGQKIVTLPINGPARFFRLRKP